MRWWERWPKRLEYELDELKSGGVPFSIDESARQRGLMRLRLQYQIAGEPVELVATYPDLYPYFRMEIQAPSLELAYHQNPFLKNLCLLGRSTVNWSAHMTLLTMLREQLPNVVSAAVEKNVEVVGGIEEHQAEPFGEYYPYDPSSVVLVDGAMEIDPDEKSGTIRIGIPTDVSVLGRSFFRGALLEVGTNSGCVLARADQRIRDLYAGQVIIGRWVRVQQPTADIDQRNILEQVEGLDPGASNNPKVQYATGLLETWGMLLREEVRWRQGCEADRWVFVNRFQERQSVAPPGVLRANVKHSKKKRR